MIDRLKVGEVAELEDRYKIKSEQAFHYLTKEEDGDIKWCDREVENVSGPPLMMYGEVVQWKWRILPNYVSFGEAMEANRTKKVFFHGLKGDAQPIECNLRNLHIRRLGSLQIEKYSLHSLVEGYWTIEEESQ